MNRDDCLKRFDEFVHFLTPMDRVGVMVHCDADGLMSGVIASHALKALRGKPADVFFCSGYPAREVLQKKIDFLREKRVSKVLVLDLSLDQDDFLINGLESFAEVLFIDHHKVYNDLNSKKTVFIKANWILPGMDSSRYPASKMVFDLFSRHCDLPQSAWLACVGVFADCAVEQWREFFDAETKKIRSSLEEIKACAKVIDAVGIIDFSKFNELYETFLKAAGPKDILKSEFFKLSQDLDSEMNYWLSEFEKKAELIPELELVWFVYTPRFPIKSPFINKISFDLYPDKTVVLVQLMDGAPTANFSARRQDGKMRVNDLLEASVIGISGGSAGGHAPAAAGKVPKGELEVFKKNLILELQKQYLKK